MPFYVKTVYEPEYSRGPSIEEYAKEADAKGFVKICLQWGIGIVSCKLIPEEEAKIELTRQDI